ncbi:MAG: hypothetical protein E6J63_20615 [Deltaproteobacteria bacterium]|nr:MAG: hypothetical protein E6J63_20615 [Deltaproteobacteria bacterium]
MGHWKAGIEVYDLVTEAIPLIDAGVAEYVRDEPIPQRDAAAVERNSMTRFGPSCSISCMTRARHAVEVGR